MIDITSLERFPAETPRPSITAPATAQPVASSEASATKTELPSQAPQPASASPDVRFDVEENDRVVIRIGDPETGEVVRQIPSEVMLRIADMITEARGGTVDASA